jgi:hypothetical protein
VLACPTQSVRSARETGHGHGRSFASTRRCPAAGDADRGQRTKAKDKGKRRKRTGKTKATSKDHGKDGVHNCRHICSLTTLSPADIPHHFHSGASIDFLHQGSADTRTYGMSRLPATTRACPCIHSSPPKRYKYQCQIVRATAFPSSHNTIPFTTHPALP